MARVRGIGEVMVRELPDITERNAELAARAKIALAVVGDDQWALALVMEMRRGCAREEAAARAAAHLREIPDYYWRLQALTTGARAHWADRERPLVSGASALSPHGASVSQASALASMALRSGHLARDEAHHYRHRRRPSIVASVGVCALFVLLMVILAASARCPATPSTL